MTTEVTGPGTVLIDSKQYRLLGKVRSSVNSQLVEKQVFGDFSDASHKDTSIRGQDSWTGGIGLERIDGNEHTDRCWWSTADLRQAHHLTLPPLATQTETFENGRTGAILIGELDGAIVTAVGTSVQSYNGSAWTEQHIAAAAPTDVISITMDKSGTFTEFLIYAYTTGYAYSDAIATWATSAKDVVKMAFWDERLWGIDATGLLWYTYTVGSAEVNDAQLPLSHNDAVTGLFMGPGPNGQEVLYATTKKGLWRHDYGNRKWINTTISLPANPAATGISRQATLWRGIPHIAANTGFKRFFPGATTQYEEAIRLGHDNGLKKTREGRVFCMADSTPDLLIGTQVVNSTDRAAIFQWNDQNGFQVLWEAQADNISIDSLHVSDAVTNYRCWFGYNNRVWWIRLHDTVGNPTQVEGWTYTDQVVRHETSWFCEHTDDTKVLMQAYIETDNLTTAIYVKPYVGFDFSETWTELTEAYSTDSTFDATDDRIEGDGITTFTFPSEAAPAGTAYRSIRWRFDMATGTNTITPDMVSFRYRFYTQPADRESFTFQLDLTKPVGKRSPKEQRADLQTATESDTLVPFTFRDDTGGTRDYYVNISLKDADEESGHDESGMVLVRCSEPS